MPFYTPEQLTMLLSKSLSPAFPGEDVKIFVAPYESGNGLFIQVNQPPITHYKGERTMFGKSLRTLLHLQDKCNLLNLLNYYDLEKIAVTEASSPSSVNKTNTTILNTSFIKTILTQLAVLKHAGNSVVEQGIKSLISENAHL